MELEFPKQLGPDIKSRIVGYGFEAADQLLAHPDNWRVHPKAQDDALEEALTSIGWVMPILVNVTTQHILDGHDRQKLADKHDAMVPVCYVELTIEEEEKILATFDLITNMAGTDKEKLSALRERLADLTPSLRQMLDRAAGLRTTKPDGDDSEHEAATEDVWNVQSGDLWLVPSLTSPGSVHRLLCGDSTSDEDIRRLMGRDRADCVFTSPPYAVGVDYGTYQDTIANLRAMLPKLARLWRSVVVEGGYAVINFGDLVAGKEVAGSDTPCEYPMALEYWPVFREAGWALWSRRVWCKPPSRVHSPWCASSNRAASDWEHIWTWKAPGTSIIGNGASSQVGWYDQSKDIDPVMSKSEHGAAMPAIVASRFIQSHSHPGAVVHEPFCGTGSTFVAAEACGRVCYAMEIEPAYVAIALDRFAAAGLKPKKDDHASPQTN